MIVRFVVGSAAASRPRLGRRVALLAATSMTGSALCGGLAFAAAGPGSPDFLPNSGHQSNPMGASYAINKDATISCTGDAVGSLSGTYDLTVQGAAAQGAYLILYITPNDGSNADPIGNVEDNEVKIDLSGKASGTYPWSLTITSPFTATGGGILALFATPGTADDWIGGRANSLQCAESHSTPSPSPTPSPTPSEGAATPTPSPTPSEGAATPTLPRSGSEIPAAGTPSRSLPSTSTSDDAAQRGRGAPLALLLVLLAVGASGLIILSPPSVRPPK
jgi:hypothetical protein